MAPPCSTVHPSAVQRDRARHVEQRDVPELDAVAVQQLREQLRVSGQQARATEEYEECHIKLVVDTDNDSLDVLIPAAQRIFAENSRPPRSSPVHIRKDAGT